MEKSIIIYFGRGVKNYLIGFLSKKEESSTEKVTCMLEELLKEKGENVDKCYISRVPDYSVNYMQCSQEYKEEKEGKMVPEIYSSMENIDFSKYNKVYLCYPIYFGTIPFPMYKFLENFKISSDIYPVILHEGSESGKSLKDLNELFEENNIKKELVINSSRLNDLEKITKEIKEWLK